MNNEALEFLKNEYCEGLKNRDRDEEYFCNLLEAKEKLEAKHIIRKYLNILEEIKNSNSCFFNDETIMLQAYDSLKNSSILTNTNEIYFYYGTYKETDKGIIQVSRDTDTGQYDIYKDIESCDYIENPVELRSEFESSHKVIIFHKPFPSNADFNDVHKDFLNTAIEEGQEAACAKVLSRKF